MVSGHPIQVGPALSAADPDFEERVEQLHAAVVAEILRLYYAHREEYGWGDRELVVC